MLRFLRGANKRTKTIWWVLIVVTCVTFVGGFVFLLGADLTGSDRSTAGEVGTVNGKRISRDEYLAAVNEQRAQFKTRYGVDPADRDAKSVETQAWRSLVARRLFEAKARAEGIGVSPREVVIAMQTSPPAAITQAAPFQTNGQFDPQKYAAALRDPANNWAGVEAMVREQLPVRKLQERLISSVKLSEPELLQSFHDRFDRAVASVVFVPGRADTGEAPPAEADLQRVYDKYRNRFATPARTQLEMLIVPKTIGDSEIEVARESAQGFVQRARAGEDWNTLVRDYSELQTGGEGGTVDRVFQPAEFGPEMGPKMAVMKVGDVSDPLRDGTRFIVFKVLDRPAPAAGAPGGLKVGQLVVKIRPDEEKIREQFEALNAIRKRAQASGLGTAATEKGLPTQTSEFYNANNAPQSLFGIPEAADWGLGAKEAAVSPVFEGVDDFAIVQVKVQQAAGIVARDKVGEALRQIATMDARVEKVKAVSEALGQAVGAGQSLEQAAAAQGLPVQRIEGLNRRQPDPRVAAAPEFVGALFGAAPGKVIGPMRGLNGWYLGRLESLAVADTALYSQAKGQISSEILQQRQNNFFNEFLASLRGKAKVADLRSAGN